MRFWWCLLIGVLFLGGCSDIQKYNPWSSVQKNTTPVITVQNSSVVNVSVNSSTSNESFIGEVVLVSDYSAIISVENHTMVFDTGSKSDNLIQPLKRFGNVSELFLSSSNDAKLGNAEIVMLKYKPTVYWTGMKSDAVDVERIAGEINVSLVTLLDDKSFKIGFVEINVYAPYRDGFFSEFDDNTMVLTVKTPKAYIILFSTCGEDCREKLSVANNADFVALPYAGNCSRMDLYDVIRYSSKAVTRPKCDEYQVKLNDLDYEMVSVPVTIKILEDGGIKWK